MVSTEYKLIHDFDGVFRFEKLGGREVVLQTEDLQQAQEFIDKEVGDEIEQFSAVRYAIYRHDLRTERETLEATKSRYAAERLGVAQNVEDAIALRRKLLGPETAALHPILREQAIGGNEWIWPEATQHENVNGTHVEDIPTEQKEA